MKYLKILLLISMIAGSLFAEPGLALYILPFDNLDETIDYDWLETGFADFLVTHFDSRPDIIAIRTSNIGSDFSGIELSPDYPNLLLAGSFSHQPGYYLIEINLTDLKTLAQYPKKTVAIHAKDMAEVIRQVNENIESMVIMYRREKPAKLPAVSEKEEQAPANTKVYEGYQVTKNLSDAITTLFEQPDVQNDPPIIEENSGLTSGNLIPSEVKSHYQNSRIFEKILAEIIETPYNIEVSDPIFKRNPANHKEMIVQFSVFYALQEDLISGLIETLPARKNISDKYIEYFFTLDNFSFRPSIIESIQRGAYNYYSVIVLTATNGLPLYHIYDIPATWKIMPPGKTSFYSDKFDPGLFFSVAQNGIKIHLKKTRQEVKYTIPVPMEKLRQILSVSVMVTNEDKIMTNQYHYQNR